MQLSVAANYDLDAVADLAAHGVAEVYGKLPSDAAGGGRPSYMAAPLTWRRLGAYVAALAARGIAFNYLLNASCLGNREWSGAFQKRFLRLLGRLRAIGVARVTVLDAVPAGAGQGGLARGVRQGGHLRPDRHAAPGAVLERAGGRRADAQKLLAEPRLRPPAGHPRERRRRAGAHRH